LRRRSQPLRAEAAHRWLGVQPTATPKDPRLSAEPKRWISVTPPVSPVERVSRGFLRVCLEIVTIPRTCVRAFGLVGEQS
jgi:hypothetical protein